MTTQTAAPVVDVDIIHTLVVSPQFAHDGVCFAARDSALYRSDDGGQSWQSCYESLGLAMSLATTSVAVSPDFSADRTLFAGVHGAVLRSINGGATWQVTMLPSPPPLVTAVTASPCFSEDRIVFAGTLEDGMFRSEDSGRTWAAWNFGLLDLSVLALAISPHFGADETVFAGTGSGLFRSTNGGRSWHDIALPPEFTSVLSIALVRQADDSTVLYVGTEGDGLFSSVDFGSTWTQSGPEVLAGAINTILSIPHTTAKPQLLVLLNDTLVVSPDGGASWAAWHAFTGEQAVAAIASAPASDGTVSLLLGTAGGEVHSVASEPWGKEVAQQE